MLAAGDQAPKLDLKSVDGERFTLGDRLTFAVFFKTTCPTCQYAWPFYERLYEAYKDVGLDVWGISQHDRDKTRQFAKTYEADFPHLIDEGFQASLRYNPEFVPTGFLISKEGEIIKTVVSWNREELDQLSSEIASRLKTKPKVLIEAGEKVVPFKPG